jgi:isopropylmalate/homocitrate/citramalate synthase
MHRTSTIDAPGVPDEEKTPPEEPKVSKLHQMRQNSTTKKALQKRIDALPYEDSKKRLAEKLAMAKSKEDIDDVEKEVIEDEKLQGDMDFNWTLQDLTSHYKKRMHEQIDPEIIRFNERAQYYKELLKQRSK